MPKLWGSNYSRDELVRRVGDLSQVASVVPYEFADGNERGCKAVLIRNAGGLELTVLTDRGMGVYDFSYRGIPLAFKTAAGPVHPSYCSSRGFDWLSSWPAGFLTPCGLTNVGSPCVDGAGEQGLHGRIAAIAARNVSSGVQWTSDEECDLFVEGTMRETTFFGENLCMIRRISTRVGESRMWIEDAVENQGQDPAPFMFLQHINLGFPLIDEHSRLLLPACTTAARDDDALAGIGEWGAFTTPKKSFREQVFYHDCEADGDNSIRVALINREFGRGTGIGVYIKYKKDEFPNLAQWKMMKQGIYVCGIEPANCHVEGRLRERERGTLVMLGRGERRSFTMEIGVLYGVEELETCDNSFPPAASD